MGYGDYEGNRPDTKEAWMLLNHYLISRPSKTLAKDNDNNRHPRQSFIYNTSITDMLIYSNSRGVSVVSSLFSMKLLVSSTRDNTLLILLFKE